MVQCRVSKKYFEYNQLLFNCMDSALCLYFHFCVVKIILELNHYWFKKQKQVLHADDDTISTALLRTPL